MTAEAVAKALGGRKAGAAWMCGADGAPPSFTAVPRRNGQDKAPVEFDEDDGGRS